MKTHMLKFFRLSILAFGFLFFYSCTDDAQKNKKSKPTLLSSIFSGDSSAPSSETIVQTQIIDETKSVAILKFLEPLVSFGVSLTPVTREILIQNVGTGKATNISGSISGTDFTFDGGNYPGTNGNCGSELNVNEQCKIFVKYTPGTSVTSLGVISLKYDGATKNIIFNATLTASKKPLPILVTQPDSLNFNGVTSISTRSLIVQNAGTANATNISFSIIDEAKEFTITSDTCTGTSLSFEVNKGNICTLVVTYSPKAISGKTEATEPNAPPAPIPSGNSLANLKFNYESSDKEPFSQTMELKGFKLAKLVFVTSKTAPRELDLSNPMTIEPDVPQTITLQNTGSYPATLISIPLFKEIRGFEGFISYSLARPNPKNSCSNLMVSPGETCSFDVSLTSQSKATDRAMVSITYFDGTASSTAPVANTVLEGLQLASTSPQSLTVECASTVANACQFNSISRNLGNNTISFLYSITNKGDSSLKTQTVRILPISYSSSDVSTNFSVLPAPNKSCPVTGSTPEAALPISLPLNDKCFFTLQYRGNATIDAQTLTGVVRAPFTYPLADGKNRESLANLSITATLIPKPTFGLTLAPDGVVDCSKNLVISNPTITTSMTSPVFTAQNQWSSVSQTFAVCNPSAQTTSELKFVFGSTTTQCENPQADGMCAVAAKSSSQINGKFVLSFTKPLTSQATVCSQNMRLEAGKSCVFTVTYTPDTTVTDYIDTYLAQFVVQNETYPGLNNSGTVPSILLVNLPLTGKVEAPSYLVSFADAAVGCTSSITNFDFAPTSMSGQTRNLAICNADANRSSMPFRFDMTGCTQNQSIYTCSANSQSPTNVKIIYNFSPNIPGFLNCKLNDSLTPNGKCAIAVTYVPDADSEDYTTTFTHTLRFSNDQLGAGSIRSLTVRGKGIVPQLCTYTEPRTDCDPNNLRGTSNVAFFRDFNDKKSIYVKNLGQAFKVEIRVSPGSNRSTNWQEYGTLNRNGPVFSFNPDTLLLYALSTESSVMPNKSLSYEVTNFFDVIGPGIVGWVGHAAVNHPTLFKIDSISCEDNSFPKTANFRGALLKSNAPCKIDISSTLISNFASDFSQERYRTRFGINFNQVSYYNALSFVYKNSIPSGPSQAPAGRFWNSLMFYDNKFCTSNNTDMLGAVCGFYNGGPVIRFPNP